MSDHAAARSPARLVLVGHGVLWAGLVVWTIGCATQPVASPRVVESWLHLVNLVFHEAGHVLFRPYGPLLAAAGGSLVQLLVPVACATAFWRRGDRFGATVACWWAGQNLVDIAPYIGDARALRLVLVGGRTGAEVEGHDWAYLLGALGWLQHDRSLAAAAHVLGVGIMALALAAGLGLLWHGWPREQPTRAEHGGHTD